MALLRFSAERAQWVTDERWYPQLVKQFLTDGRYELRLPYREDRELAMEVLRHEAAVEVISPESLRLAVREQLQRAVAQYSGNPITDLPRTPNAKLAVITQIVGAADVLPN